MNIKKPGKRGIQVSTRVQILGLSEFIKSTKIPCLYVHMPYEFRFSNGIVAACLLLSEAIKPGFLIAKLRLLHISGAENRFVFLLIDSEDFVDLTEVNISCVEHGDKLILVWSGEELCRYLSALLKPVSTVSNQKNRSKTVSNSFQICAQALKLLGPSRMKEIKGIFKTVRGLLLAKEEAFEAVPGIGKTLAKRLETTFNAQLLPG